MSNAHSSANRQESITPTTHIKKESTPHGLLSFSFPKGNTAQNHVDFPRIPRRITPPEMSV